MPPPPERRLERASWLPRRLGAQLYLVAALSLGLSIFLYGLHTVRDQSNLALSAIEEQTRAMARDLALLGEPLIVADKLDDVEVLLRNVMELPQVLEARVVDADGLRLSHIRREAGQAPNAVFGEAGHWLSVPTVLEPSVTYEEDRQRVVAWQPIVSGTVLGWVRVDHGTESLAQLRQRIWAETAVACLLACLLSIAMMRAFLRRPLQALRAAQAFAADLQRIEGQQLSGIDGPLEMRDLSCALNQASRRLFEQRSTIEASLLRLRQQEAKLASTNEQLRTIFALSPDALLTIDDNGHASFANEAFFQMTGLSTHEVVGQPWQQLDSVLCGHAELEGTAPPLARLMADGTGEPLQLVLARPRMTVLEIRARVGQTASVSWLFYISDITRESEIDRMKSEFLSTAAHELRTPMTGIFSCVELLTTRELPANRQKDLLGIVSRQSRAMMNIVNELLDVSRLEARGSADFCQETLPLHDALGPAVADFVPPSGRDAPAFLLTREPAFVHVDPAKLGQVVANLLSNAYKYSAAGPVQVRCLPERHSSRGTQTGFEVEDHGIGMTAEQLARVTERFYRADASGHVLGTGLGMSIVDNIVSLLGGNLELRSEPGHGTTVTVWLPAVVPTVTPAASAASPELVALE